MQIEKFKKAVGKFPTGVCVVLAVFEDRNFGLTVNSFSSVSLSPPMISFCLDKASGSFRGFAGADIFSVSILASDQADISRHFACKSEDKFKNIDYVTNIDCISLPVIKNALSFLECKKIRQIECGDHVIFIGEVIKTFTNEANTPLVYYGKSYRTVK